MPGIAGFRDRRHVMGLLVAALLSPGIGNAHDQIFVISRDRVLSEVIAAQQLRQAEAEMSRVLQAQIDSAKEVLSAEETELAQVRGTLSQEEFETRAANFDRRVRQTRRIANERAATMKKGFQESRAKIFDSIPELLEQVRLEAGARIILDADPDQIILFDPALDLTDRLIEVFDQAMPVAPVPQIDLSQPILTPEETSQDGGESRDQ